MNSSRQLYDLQEVDWYTSARRDSLADTRVRLEDNRALLFARSRAEEVQQHVTELQSRQRRIALELESVREKAERVDKKLYGGSVRNPRELSGLDEESKLLRSRQRKHEDELLEVMVAAEEAQRSLQEAQAGLNQVESEWRDEHARLLQEQERLLIELSSLDQRRQSIASLLAPSDLSLYESLRKSGHGQAVAKVERGMCQGCRIVLPTKELQRARMAQGLVQCSSCGRILYVS